MSRRKGLQRGHLCRNIILAGPHGLQRAVQKPVQLPAKAFRALASVLLDNRGGCIPEPMTDDGLEALCRKAAPL